MKNLVVIVIFAFIQFRLAAQPVYSPIEDINFIVEKLQLNYPGFEEKADSGFTKLVTSIKKRAQQLQTEEEKFSEISKIILFFKDLHLRIRLNYPNQKNTDSLNEIYLPGTKNRNEYFNDKNTSLWQSDENDVLFSLKKTGNKEYKATIVASSIDKKQIGKCLFVLKEIQKNYYQTTLLNIYRGNSIGCTISYFQGNDTLITGVFGRWIKCKALDTTQFYKLPKFSYEPEINKLNDSFVLVKIPKSDYTTKRKVDSLVVLRKNDIEQIPNLIIDIRNNTGGTWLVYQALFPYLCTKPILITNGYYKCSDDHIQYLKNVLKKNDTVNLFKLLFFYKRVL